MNPEDRIQEDWENQRKGTGLVYLTAQADIKWLVEVARGVRQYHDERHFYPLEKCVWPMCKSLHALEQS